MQETIKTKQNSEMLRIKEVSYKNCPLEFEEPRTRTNLNGLHRPLLPHFHPRLAPIHQ